MMWAWRAPEHHGVMKRSNGNKWHVMIMSNNGVMALGISSGNNGGENEMSRRGSGENGVCQPKNGAHRSRKKIMSIMAK